MKHMQDRTTVHTRNFSLTRLQEVLGEWLTSHRLWQPISDVKNSKRQEFIQKLCFFAIAGRQQSRELANLSTKGSNKF